MRPLIKGKQPISNKNIELKNIFLLIPHAKRLGIDIIGEEDGSLVIEMPYNPELEIIPSSGIIANGAITALLDTALGAAVYSQFEVYRRIVTLNLRVDYFEKPEAFSSVMVKTRCLKISDQIIFAQGDLFCQNRDITIAHAVGVFSYADAEKI